MKVCGILSPCRQAGALEQGLQLKGVETGWGYDRLQGAMANLGHLISNTGLLFVPLCLRLRGLHQADLASSRYITRSRAWIFTGAAVAIIFIVVLSHGVRS